MSYLVLARKYRPQNFGEMVGQKAVVHTLKRAIELERIHHAFLFTGSRGVGKTTIARLMAKCLSCETGLTATPCGTCSACVGIGEGNWVDVREIDGASNTGVDDVRVLRESALYQPSASRFKIFIIDEVHMLSTSAFNALLKILEEPPPHVKFMFATTEPHKIPITILSRCQRYDFGRISKEQIIEQLNHVLSQEGISVEASGLRLIADAADGGMRDALSLLDQVLSFSGAQATETQVAQALGLVDRSQVVSLVEAVLAKDTHTALTILGDVHQRGINLKEVMQGVAMEFRHLAVAKSAGTLEGLAELSLEDRGAIEAKAVNNNLADLQRLFSMALAGVEQAARSAQTQLAVELVVLKMLERPPLSEMVAVSQAMARLEALAKGHKPDFNILGQAPSAVAAPVNSPVPVKVPLPQKSAPVSVPKEVIAPVLEQAPVLVKDVPTPTAEVPAPVEAKDVQEERSVPDEDPVLEASLEELERVDMNSLILESMPLEGIEPLWLDFISDISKQERKLASHLEHAFFTADSSFTKGALCLVFKKKLHHSALEAVQSTDFFKDIFQKHFTAQLDLEASYDPDFQETGPSVQKARRYALEKAHAALRAHADENPVVQKALSLFGGEVKSVERLV
jgi:DNA polymerase III subunit gamma/tau